jgi:DNA primase
MSSWIEFASIKQTVPLMAVLERYQIAGLRRSGREQWRGRCPLHSGESQDSFHVNTGKQLFHCFSCGTGGTVLDLVAALEHCGIREAAQKLVEGWAVDASGFAQASAAPQQTTVTEKRSGPRPLGFRLSGVDGRHAYLSMRGISEQTAAEFEIGFYAGPGLLSQRLVIPIHDEVGRLVAYCGRAVDGSGPRYKFPAGFPKSQILFNFHRARASGEERVIVVEGFFDCLKVHQAGFRSVVALMGAALYDRQRRLLTEHFRRITLMLDGDAAGRHASAVIATQLERCCRVRMIQLATNTQPDQLAAEAIQALLAEKGGEPNNP